MGKIYRRYVRISAISLLLFFQQTAFSGIYMKNLKDDQSVPEHCRETVIKHFEVEELGIFTVSVEGKRKPSKFTFEYPLKRGQANFLWKVMKNFAANGYITPADLRAIKADPQLNKNFQMLKNNYEERGFHFGSEGEILELLTHVALQESFDADKANVFVTGSVEYKEYKSSQAIGELDVVIADKTTCKVIAYGEAKLGAHRYSKAWSQVHRFLGFLKSKSIEPHYAEVEDNWMAQASFFSLKPQF